MVSARTRADILIEAVFANKVTSSFIYFISNQKGAVKIGKSVNPVERLIALQTANPDPLALIGVLRGGCKLETDLHWYFQEEQIRGEWFNLTDDIKHFISIYCSSEDFDAVACMSYEKEAA